MPRRYGFTLVEMLVVLVLMGLAAALVAPTLLRPRDDRSPWKELLESARAAAARRGEVVYLSIAPTGEWRMAGADPLVGTFATGHVKPLFASAVTLAVSPLGGCAFDVRTASATGSLALDPLTCEIRAP